MAFVPSEEEEAEQEELQEHSGEEANNPAPAMDETFHIGEEGLSSRTQEFISVTTSPNYTFSEM